MLRSLSLGAGGDRGADERGDLGDTKPAVDPGFRSRLWVLTEVVGGGDIRKLASILLPADDADPERGRPREVSSRCFFDNSKDPMFFFEGDPGEICSNPDNLTRALICFPVVCRVG